MRITKVIPSKRYQHKITKRQVSVYSAHPGMPGTYDEWEIVQVGWTWELDNGIVGICRVPAKTEAEAIEVMEKYNNRS
jgi:hypothetical protein